MFKMKLFSFFFVFLYFVASNQNQHGHRMHFLVSNKTIAGLDNGCKFSTQYVTTSSVTFQMCTGQTHQDLKNGMSIINTINARGFLPTCRVMQLMLWMFSEVVGSKMLNKDFFVDIGANIGSCSVHMASLGFPVISVEPVQQHVDTIRGSIDINPSFHIDLHHIGMSSSERTIHANFGHGSRNWGATEFHEVSRNESFETELRLKTLEQVIGGRKVSLLKVDCEGCEWAALKGAQRALRRVSMIKIEVVQPSYSAGNETVTAEHVLLFLQNNGFALFTDLWAENDLYFGRRNNEILEIDRMFGSKKFKEASVPDILLLHSCAKRVLAHPINASNFNHKHFMRSATDVIAIENTLAEKMKRKWLD